MISEFFTNYQFENKSSLLNVMDALLSPTRLVLGCKTIQHDADNKSFREEDQRCQNVFCRILLAPIALLLLPVTLVACLIKVVEGSAQKVHQLYQMKSEKSSSVEENEPFRSGSAQESSNQRPPSIKPVRQEQIFNREKLEEFRAHATGVRYQIELLTDQEVAVIGDLLNELLGFFEERLASRETQMKSTHFTIERVKPHVFKLHYHDPEGKRRQFIASERGQIETHRNFVYRLFEGCLLSLQDVILGTADSDQDDEFYIYHKEIINDPFDAEHITSNNGDGNGFMMTKQGYVFFPCNRFSWSDQANVT